LKQQIANRSVDYFPVKFHRIKIEKPDQ